LNPHNHVVALCHVLQTVINTYAEQHEECDVNDVMSALASMLVQYCKQFDVPRTELLRNVSFTFENTDIMGVDDGQTH
jgi:hypothetical protein